MFRIFSKSLRIVLDILTVEVGKREKNAIFSLGILKKYFRTLTDPWKELLFLLKFKNLENVFFFSSKKTNTWMENL